MDRQRQPAVVAGPVSLGCEYSCHISYGFSAGSPPTLNGNVSPGQSGTVLHMGLRRAEGCVWAF